jgi:hypothetical protein
MGRSSQLVKLALVVGHRPARDRDRVASPGLSPALRLEARFLSGRFISCGTAEKVFSANQRQSHFHSGI